MPVLWLVVICTSSTIASQAKIIIPLTKVPCVHWALPVDCAVVGVQYCNINALLSEIGFPAFLITPVSGGHAVSMCCHFWTCFDEVLKGLLTVVLHSASSFMQEWSNLATHIISDSQTPIPQGGMLNLWLLDPMTPRGLTSTSKESGVVPAQPGVNQQLIITFTMSNCERKAECGDFWLARFQTANIFIKHIH